MCTPSTASFSPASLEGWIAMASLSKNAAAAWLKATAAQCEEWRSDQQVSDMLRDLADTIIDPEAAPRWTPRVIEGGKTD